jgi:hypothetical protein
MSVPGYSAETLAAAAQQAALNARERRLPIINGPGIPPEGLLEPHRKFTPSLPPPNKPGMSASRSSSENLSVVDPHAYAGEVEPPRPTPLKSANRPVPTTSSIKGATSKPRRKIGFATVAVNSNSVVRPLTKVPLGTYDKTYWQSSENHKAARNARNNNPNFKESLIEDLTAPANATTKLGLEEARYHSDAITSPDPTLIVQTVYDGLPRAWDGVSTIKQDLIETLHDRIVLKLAEYCFNRTPRACYSIIYGSIQTPHWKNIFLIMLRAVKRTRSRFWSPPPADLDKIAKFLSDIIAKPIETTLRTYLERYPSGDNRDIISSEDEKHMVEEMLLEYYTWEERTFLEQTLLELGGRIRGKPNGVSDFKRILSIIEHRGPPPSCFGGRCTRRVGGARRRSTKRNRASALKRRTAPQEATRRRSAKGNGLKRRTAPQEATQSRSSRSRSRKRSTARTTVRRPTH